VVDSNELVLDLPDTPVILSWLTVRILVEAAMVSPLEPVTTSVQLPPAIRLFQTPDTRVATRSVALPALVSLGVRERAVVAHDGLYVW
jgi:hypothetical protein